MMLMEVMVVIVVVMMVVMVIMIYGGGRHDDGCHMVFLIDSHDDMHMYGGDDGNGDDDFKGVKDIL